MVNIRNVKGKYAFLHILFGKAFSYLNPLHFFHNYNYISPRKLFFSNWFCGIKPSRLGFKSAFKYLLSSLAPILVLITNKQYIHFDIIKQFPNLNLSINRAYKTGKDSSIRMV